MRKHILLVLIAVFASFTVPAAAQGRGGELYTDSLWIQYVAPNPDKGFSFGYFLAVPRGLDREQKYFLLAEADPHYFRTDAGRAGQTAGALAFLQGYPLLDTLKTPVIMPVFTSPASAPNLRPGSLDRDIMLTAEGSLKRPDLQFLAMVKDARARLKKEGLKTYKKIWLNGAASSGDFCARFTFLHPKNVQAAVCGVPDGLVPLPLQELDGRELVYPLGTADVKELTGKEFDLKNWKKTPQFYYAGSAGDSVRLSEAVFMGRNEARDALEIFGMPLSARWGKTRSLLSQSAAALQTHLYLWRGSAAAWQDAAAFFKANGGEVFSPTFPKEK